MAYLIAGAPMIPYLVLALFALLVLGIIAMVVAMFILPHFFAGVSEAFHSVFRKRSGKPPTPKKDSN